jgi:hypothetical protein
MRSKRTTSQSSSLSKVVVATHLKTEEAIIHQMNPHWNPTREVKVRNLAQHRKASPVIATTHRKTAGTIIQQENPHRSPTREVKVRNLGPLRETLREAQAARTPVMIALRRRRSVTCLASLHQLAEKAIRARVQSRMIAGVQTVAAREVTKKALAQRQVKTARQKVVAIAWEPNNLRRAQTLQETVRDLALAQVAAMKAMGRPQKGPTLVA